MKKYQTIFAAILTILSLAFIVFVFIMQQNFTNPEFTDLPAPPPKEEAETAADDEEADNEDADSVAGAAGSVVNETEADEEAEEEEETETETEGTYSVRTVIAETLNARSGPGIEYELTGVLVQGQEVEAEDSDDDWVKVITDEFTGYVNQKYLSEK